MLEIRTMPTRFYESLLSCKYCILAAHNLEAASTVMPHHTLSITCRPASLCERLGNCHEYGMPSSHAQLIFFAWMTFMLLVTRTPASGLAPAR